jgi:FXSXX-COOH protein
MAESSSDLGDCLTGVGLPEVGHVPIRELLRSEHPAIAEAVRRVQRDAEMGRQNYAAFGNVP